MDSAELETMKAKMAELQAVNKILDGIMVAMQHQMMFDEFL